jgi:hypothetical protein
MILLIKSTAVSSGSLSLPLTTSSSTLVFQESRYQTLSNKLKGFISGSTTTCPSSTTIWKVSILPFLILTSPTHCLYSAYNTALIIMTADDRDFNRLARLTTHNLEVFRHLQEMCFEDPRMVLDALTNLIDQTVCPPEPSLQVIANYHFRRLLSSCLDSILSCIVSFKKFSQTSASISSRIRPLRLPTAGTSWSRFMMIFRRRSGLIPYVSLSYY